MNRQDAKGAKKKSLETYKRAIPDRLSLLDNSILLHLFWVYLGVLGVLAV